MHRRRSAPRRRPAPLRARGSGARAILQAAGGPEKMKDGGEILEDRMHDGVGYKICWNLIFGASLFFLFIFTDRRPYTRSVGDALATIVRVGSNYSWVASLLPGNKE